MHPMRSHLTLLAILLGTFPANRVPFVVGLVFTVSRFAFFLPRTPWCHPPNEVVKLSIGDRANLRLAASSGPWSSMFGLMRQKCLSGEKFCCPLTTRAAWDWRAGIILFFSWSGLIQMFFRVCRSTSRGKYASGRNTCDTLLLFLAPIRTARWPFLVTCGEVHFVGFCGTLWRDEIIVGNENQRIVTRSNGNRNILLSVNYRFQTKRAKILIFRMLA